MTLEIEAVDGDQPVLITSRDIDVSTLQPAGGWSLLTVEAVAPVSKLRVLIRIAPSEAAQRAGAVKLDDAFLVSPTK